MHFQNRPTAGSGGRDHREIDDTSTARTNAAMTDKSSSGQNTQVNTMAPIDLPGPMDTTHPADNDALLNSTDRSTSDSESTRSFSRSPTSSCSGGEMAHMSLDRSSSSEWNLDSTDPKECGFDFTLRDHESCAQQLATNNRGGLAQGPALKIGRLLQEITGHIDGEAWVEIKAGLEKYWYEMEALKAANQVLVGANQMLVETKYHLEERTQALEDQKHSLEGQIDTLTRSAVEYETQLAALELKQNRMVTEAKPSQRMAFQNLPALLTRSLMQVDVSEEERQNYYDRTFASGVKSKVGTNIAPRPPKKASSQLPKKAAYDKHVPGGIPEQAMGKFLYNGLASHLREMRLKALLLRAQIALIVNDSSQAEMCTVAAGEIALALGNSALMGKCSYWRGLAELQLQKYSAAALSFEETRKTCEGRYIEWESVEEKLSYAREMASQTQLMGGPGTTL